MKKTSIYLEPSLDEALAQRAAEDGVSKAEFIRRVLAGAVTRQRRPKPSVGIFSSGKTDVSQNVDKYLRKTGFGEI